MASAQLQPVARRSSLADHRRLYELASKLYSTAVEQKDNRLLNEALANARLAWSLRPEYLPGLNLLARIEMQRGDYQQAEHWVQQGLSLKPESTGLLYSAGHIALAQHQLQQAEDYFERSARISRVATRSVNSLAHVKLLQGDYVEAFRHYRELVKTQARDRQLRSKLFEAASHVVADFYSEELEQDLLRYLDFSDVDFSHLRPLATSLLKHKLHLSEEGCPLELAAIAGDPLLLKCLARFCFCDPVMERLLLTIRQSLLLSCSKNLAIRADILPLVAAIDRQCQLNESVWYISSQEQELVSQLSLLVSKILSLPDIRADDIYPALTLVLMYQPLLSCEFLPALRSRRFDWPELLADFIQDQLHEQTLLEKISASLPAIGQSDDQTSQRVQRQYDENPYPRWTDIGYNQPSDYRRTLQQTFPLADLSAVSPVCPQVLVAGCGTGRHAIRLAHYFSPLNITALDLSKAAVAYASLQAQKRHTPGIRFMHGNILNVAELEQSWDVIECSGVLHHMQDPAAGLQALAARLKPGGVMKIALYSTTARRTISQLRSLMGSNIPVQPGDMRLVRETLLQNALEGDWSDIYSSPDFYSLSACRDLLFHQQEHTFDVLELPDFIATAGLQWLGMLAPPGSAALLKTNGRHAGGLSCSDWHTLEQTNPALFAGMYQFYVQKPL